VAAKYFEDDLDAARVQGRRADDGIRIKTDRHRRSFIAFPRLRTWVFRQPLQPLTKLGRPGAGRKSTFEADGLAAGFLL
jgi:hypothetical protein